MRWQTEAEEAVANAGYKVVDTAGVSDYQGWGVVLGTNGGSWAVLPWNYGCN